MIATGETRVLMLGPSAPGVGGIATIVDALARSLATRVDLRVVNTGKVTARERSWRVAWWVQIRLFARVIAALARHHAHVVHIHTCSGFVFWRDVLWVPLARMFGARVVWHIHGGGFAEFIEDMHGIRRAAAALAFRASDAGIVLSRSSHLRLGRHLEPRRWAVVENGVALPSRSTAWRDTGALLFVGTLNPAKGAADLVVATAIASRRYAGGRVQIAGPETSPEEREKLQRLIEAEGLANRVELLGVVTGAQKAEAFENAVGFVLPSYVEAMPMALLEAMSYGLPVIVTDVGAIPEVVTDGVEGFVVKPGDVTELADRMTRLWTDPALRSRMGIAGRTRVEARHTVDAMAAKIVDVYFPQ